MTEKSGPSCYTASKIFSYTELTKEINTSDKREIEAILDKLDIDQPQDSQKDWENSEYKLEGKIGLARGYEETFQYDVITGNRVRARFVGILNYNGQETRINETYSDNATEIFHPLQDNISSDIKIDKDEKKALSK
jgi:hypothetical protein